MISIEQLGKRYMLCHRGVSERYRTLRDTLAEGTRAVLSRYWSRPRGGRKEVPGDFWALRNITFQAKQGEVVGIIGPNGAGKSTLLKILSRVTEPTEGRVRIRGRVASLLEVGTGFHPELTGRENIFLNGAILGMTKAEIKRKFDEIVDFAEVERFLDTPVKRYSSGMYVRLAFAVAAHLEPEILIIDEVLAVGDAAFQKKCLGRVQAASQTGRTVLFVSHNMAAVSMLCNRAVYLRAGQVEALGSTHEVMAKYLAHSSAGIARSLGRPIHFGDAQLVSFTAVPNPVTASEAVTFQWQIRAGERTRFSEWAVLIHSAEGVRVAILDLRGCGLSRRLGPGEIWSGEAKVKALPLVEGDYKIGLYTNAGTFLGNLHELFTLTVEPRRARIGPVSYAPAHRGLVELGFESQPTADVQ